MSILLEAIKFNHNPNSATDNAFNIRKNYTEFVTVPEWQSGISVNPEDSPAAYAIKETKGNTITIQAKFKFSFPHIKTNTAEIRAVPPMPHFKDPHFPWPEDWPWPPWYAKSVLGEVKAKTVTFVHGMTGFETFELQNVNLWNFGAGARTVTWAWQFRIKPSLPWTVFATTRHRIYSVLEVPKLPWQQTPYDSGNTQLPWTEVLDSACNWAVLTTNLNDAAAAVTKGVNALGPNVITYDCPGGGSSHYSLGKFNCTAFLERLRGGAGNGYYVNCSDCATIVSSFANILGCDLWQSRMGYGFALNEILGIGANTWQTACGWGSFSYHEVAWIGGCTSNDPVYDACLQVDGDADPLTPPHLALLPTNLQFGVPNDGHYRDRLATSAGRPNCEPQPTTRQHRLVI